MTPSAARRWSSSAGATRSAPLWRRRRRARRGARRAAPPRGPRGPPGPAWRRSARVRGLGLVKVARRVARRRVLSARHRRGARRAAAPRAALVTRATPGASFLEAALGARERRRPAARSARPRRRGARGDVAVRGAHVEALVQLAGLGRAPRRAEAASRRLGAMRDFSARRRPCGSASRTAGRHGWRSARRRPPRPRPTRARATEPRTLWTVTAHHARGRFRGRRRQPRRNPIEPRRTPSGARARLAPRAGAGPRRRRPAEASRPVAWSGPAWLGGRGAEA